MAQNHIAEDLCSCRVVIGQKLTGTGDQQAHRKVAVAVRSSLVELCVAVRGLRSISGGMTPMDRLSAGGRCVKTRLCPEIWPDLDIGARSAGPQRPTEGSVALTGMPSMTYVPELLPSVCQGGRMKEFLPPDRGAGVPAPPFLDDRIASLGAHYESSPCRICGSVPAEMVTFRGITGLALTWRIEKIRGPLCADCGLYSFRVCTAKILGFVPFSFPCLIIGPFFAIRNYSERRKIIELDRPRRGPFAAGAHAPLDPDPPLHWRLGFWVTPAVSLIVGISWLVHLL